MSRKLLKVGCSYAELARLQATESQLKLLQNQLDLHMLLNALSNMRVLIVQDPDRAV
jgi:LytS/YehU family sensor histidine kinase